MSFDEELGPALEEVEFLVGAEERLVVLDALARGPAGRRELSDATGLDGTAIDRVLEAFAGRGWVAEAGGWYEPTQLGAFVAREVTGLLHRVSGVPALNEVARWFPPGGFGFDLDRLADAHIVRSTAGEPEAPTAHVVDRVRTASRVRCLTDAMAPAVLAACAEAVEAGTLELECVVGASAVGGLAPTQLERAAALASADGSSIRRSGAPVDPGVLIANGTVLLCLSGDGAAPAAVIETGNPAVRFWAEDLIDAHLEDAVPLDPDAFTA